MNHKHLLKVHEDVITVPTMLNELCNEYKDMGYEVELPVFNTFIYKLSDGTKIIVYWEKGMVWEDIHTYPPGYKE